MSFRLPEGGHLIERTRPLKFRFNGSEFVGFEGDTLASALLGAGQTLVGRSFKYHRPRGIVTNGPEEPNALLGIGEGAGFEPNQRAPITELYDGLVAQSQNHWPSLNFDIGAVSGLLARFLPAGFYYKTFIHPRALWKHLYEPFIRRAAGLGKAPTQPDQDRYEHFYCFVDIVVIGGGIAGLMAAKTASEAGAKVLLVEQSPHWGGRASVDGGMIDGKTPQEWVAAIRAALLDNPNVILRNRMSCAGVYDHGYVICSEQINHRTPSTDRPRHRLWRVRAKQIIAATGAIERPLCFASNDLPGIMLASAVRDYLVNFGIAPGQRNVIVTNNDGAYQTALLLHQAGLEVAAIIDGRDDPNGPLVRQAEELGIKIYKKAGIAQVFGKKQVRKIRISDLADETKTLGEISCDSISMSGGWSPVVHHWCHCGGKLVWDEAHSFFRPDPEKPPLGRDGRAMVLPAGASNGDFHINTILSNARECASNALRKLGFKTLAKPHFSAADDQLESQIQPIWIMPENASAAKRAKMWVDFQNDVKVSDIQLAAREGYSSVEHAKRYTTLGMATDQGKLSNINGLAILSNSLNATIPETGTTTFRPPYSPISLGVIAGPARGDAFLPLRKTPLHGWHENHGAHWEPVGLWRRPYSYLRAGESIKQAVHREVINTRKNLGLLDASTLGKLIVKGPDSGKFLDMLYTNMMSTLKVRQCRYGVMCNENGFLIDDGVVARLDQETFLCHTTSNGADTIHAHMEEWLQTEWWNWDIWVSNVTEQFAQIAVVGPNARKLLEKLGGMDVSADAMPLMGWKEGQIAGFDARAFRISFSGELSYEIAVPAATGMSFWQSLIDAGREFGAMSYGTEALHIMRAEKGFIMIGNETDGTVIPQDLGLEWAISKKKTDYLGKRAHARAFMSAPTRWRLVGLETLDDSTLPDGVYCVGKGLNANHQRNVIGRVTSSYHSPTLGRGIALGLVAHGPERMGEVLDFVSGGKKIIKARIVSPLFYDSKGEKQNV